MRTRVASSRAGDGPSSISFWWRRCTEQSRSPRTSTPPVVGEHLHLDMAGADDGLLEVHPAVAERRQRLGRGDAVGVLDVGRVGDEPHAPPAASGGRLEQHRIADLGRHASARGPRRPGGRASPGRAARRPRASPRGRGSCRPSPPSTRPAGPRTPGRCRRRRARTPRSRPGTPSRGAGRRSRSSRRPRSGSARSGSSPPAGAGRRTPPGRPASPRGRRDRRSSRRRRPRSRGRGRRARSAPRLAPVRDQDALSTANPWGQAPYGAWHPGGASKAPSLAYPKAALTPSGVWPRWSAQLITPARARTAAGRTRPAGRSPPGSGGSRRRGRT